MRGQEGRLTSTWPAGQHGTEGALALPCCSIRIPSTRASPRGPATVQPSCSRDWGPREGTRGPRRAHRLSRVPGGSCSASGLAGLSGRPTITDRRSRAGRSSRPPSLGVSRQWRRAPPSCSTRRDRAARPRRRCAEVARPVAGPDDELRDDPFVVSSSTASDVLGAPPSTASWCSTAGGVVADGPIDEVLRQRAPNSPRELWVPARATRIRPPRSPARRRRAVGTSLAYAARLATSSRRGLASRARGRGGRPSRAERLGQEHAAVMPSSRCVVCVSGSPISPWCEHR